MFRTVPHMQNSWPVIAPSWRTLFHAHPCPIAVPPAHEDGIKFRRTDFLRADGGWTTNDNRNLVSHTKHEDLGQEHGKPSADETVARRSFSGCLRFRAVRRAHVVAAKTKGVDIGVSFVTKSLCHRRHATATTTVLPSSSASGDEGQRRPPCNVSSGSAKFQW